MIKHHIPNIITLCNLAVGVLAVWMAMENQIVFAAWMIFLAALLDFLDGFLARILNASSELGQQLDSFADLVSFGLAPSAILYKMMQYGIQGDIFYSAWQDTSLPERVLMFSPILLVLFSALRLGEFNLQDQRKKFSGLPTPASALFFGGMSLAVIHNPVSEIGVFLLNPLVLLAIILIISFLMISRIPMFSLKFEHFEWNGNQIRYFFLAISGILLIILQEISLPVIILVYILLSVVLSLIQKD